MNIQETTARIARSLGWSDPLEGERALVASLRAVRGQLPPEAAALYRYKLPPDVRDAYLGNWSARRSTPGKYSFLCEVEGHFKDEGIDPEEVSRRCSAFCGPRNPTSSTR